MNFPFRRRERKQAVVPMVALSQIGRALWTDPSPRALIDEGYRKNAIVYRSVRMIAEAAASVPIKARPDAPAPLARLLAMPNEDQTGAELLETFYTQLQLYGNAYLEAVQLDEDSPPSALFTIDPSTVKPMLSAQGHVMGWQVGSDHQRRRLYREPDGWCPVLHMQLYNPKDQARGLSPLHAARTAIDIHNAGADWTKALIDNSARPSGALVYGQNGAKMTDNQFDRLKSQLEEAHTGAGNAGKPMLLEGGLEWKPMSLSPDEMDFIEARREAAREIALSFGIPPMLLGIPGDNTYANYREANLAFWRQVVIPLVRKTLTSISSWLSYQYTEE